MTENGSDIKDLLLQICEFLGDVVHSLLLRQVLLLFALLSPPLRLLLPLLEFLILLAIDQLLHCFPGLLRGVSRYWAADNCFVGLDCVVARLQVVEGIVCEWDGEEDEDESEEVVESGGEASDDEIDLEEDDQAHRCQHWRALQVRQSKHVSIISSNLKYCRTTVNI